MIRPDDDPGAIFASDGSTIQRLWWSMQETPFRLTNAAGVSFAPWEVELLRWPPEAEDRLRRGGYLPLRPSETELWCNCAD